MESKTKYIDFTGKAFYSRLYQPDEFRGAVRWGLDLVVEDSEEWVKFKQSGIQKHVKEKDYGKFFPMHRPTLKMMKGKIVYFCPPVVYDKDGTVLVKYVDSNGNDIRSYDNADTAIKRIGDPVLIGNGSLVKINVSYYPTQMGVGSRLESLRILDLIEYERPETPSEVAAKVEGQIADGEEPSSPW